MDITTMTTFGALSAARVQACDAYGHLQGTGIGSVVEQKSARTMPRPNTDVLGSPPRGRPA